MPVLEPKTPPDQAQAVPRRTSARTSELWLPQAQKDGILDTLNAARSSMVVMVRWSGPAE